VTSGKPIGALDVLLVVTSGKPIGALGETKYNCGKCSYWTCHEDPVTGKRVKKECPLPKKLTMDHPYVLRPAPINTW